MNIYEKASRIRNLRNDETFKEVISEIRQAQACVFLDPASSTDVREEAHGIIRALGAIDTFFDSVLSEEAIAKKKQK